MWKRRFEVDRIKLQLGVGISLCFIVLFLGALEVIDGVHKANHETLNAKVDFMYAAMSHVANEMRNYKDELDKHKAELDRHHKHLVENQRSINDFSGRLTKMDELAEKLRQLHGRFLK